MNLIDIRNEIDEIDTELSTLFQRRTELSVQAAKYKQEHSLPMTDEKREMAIIQRAEASAKDEGMKPPVRRFIEQVLSECRRLQNEATAKQARKMPEFSGSEGVAFLGLEGSFSHEATVRCFGSGAKAVGKASFEEIVESVASGECLFGMLPVENSLTGGIFAAADLLSTGKLHITGETVLGVRHSLLGIPGASAAGITAVLSHPQPLEQCRQFIRRQGYDAKTTSSTAAAAEEVSRRADPSLAAIASESAGRIYGLVPLLRDIQDNSANYTRFVIVSTDEQPVEGANKISAVFVVEHRPGTLYGTLRAFADRSINLLNLVSRPMPGSPWQYCFHMDFDGSLSDANVQEALEQAKANCRSIVILGNYRKWEG